MDPQRAQSLASVVEEGTQRSLEDQDCLRHNQTVAVAGTGDAGNQVPCGNHVTEGKTLKPPTNPCPCSLCLKELNKTDEAVVKGVGLIKSRGSLKKGEHTPASLLLYSSSF